MPNSIQLVTAALSTLLLITPLGMAHATLESPASDPPVAIPNDPGDIMSMIVTKIIEDVSGQAGKITTRWVGVLFFVVDTRTAIQSEVNANILADDLKIRLAIDLAHVNMTRYWKPVVITLDKVPALNNALLLHKSLASFALVFPQSIRTILAAGGKLLPPESVALVVMGTVQPNGSIDWILLGAYTDPRGKPHPVFRDLDGTTRQLAEHLAGMAQSISSP